MMKKFIAKNVDKLMIVFAAIIAMLILKVFEPAFDLKLFKEPIPIEKVNLKWGFFAILWSALLFVSCIGVGALLGKIADKILQSRQKDDKHTNL